MNLSKLPYVLKSVGYLLFPRRFKLTLPIGRVFNDLIDDFTKSDYKSFWDDFEIFKIILKYGDLI
jgi:hypothetical protein